MNLRTCLLTKNQCYKAAVRIKPMGVMVHSTGANNPYLKRYVQPDDGLLGQNLNGNHWNQPYPEGKAVCVHAFIGRLADGTVAAYQTLPWDYRGWHSGRGKYGSANDMGYLGFEICEDSLADRIYFNKVYREAVELTAYLCARFALDPLQDGTVLCHAEGAQRGIASNHGDVLHWFPKHGKSMDDFRRDVAAQCGKEEQLDMTIEEMIQQMTPEQAYRLAQKAELHSKDLPEPAWSRKEGHWQRAEEAGLIDGTAPERPMRRDEVIAVLGRKGLV